MKRIPELKFTSFERIMTLVNIGLSKQDIDEFAGFLRPAMQINPRERATAKELLAHSWLKQ